MEQEKGKIEWVEEVVRQVYDWENSVTGDGIEYIQGGQSFRDAILDKYPFYFDLKLKEVFTT